MAYLIGHPVRPLNNFDLIKLSIYLAVDTGVNTISILGDFNEDQVKQQNSKIADVLVKYDMVQLFNDPNHFTETSSFVIYLAILHNPYIVDRVHVDEPFVHMHLRYHCAIYGILKIENSSHTCLKVKIWLYDSGDYDKFREKLQNANWDDILNSVNNLDNLVDMCSDIILQATHDTIPNKVISVRKSEPLRTNNIIRRAIRKT